MRRSTSKCSQRLGRRLEAGNGRASGGSGLMVVPRWLGRRLRMLGEATFVGPSRAFRGSPASDTDVEMSAGRVPQRGLFAPRC
jgi:hypothetical protein